VDVVLVKDAEDQADDHQCSEDQERHRRERVLEGLGVALEAGVDGGWKLQCGPGTRDCVGRLAERRARSEVEADGDRRKLALMADGQRLDRRRSF